MFQVGDSVRHPDHGDWTVTWIRKDCMVLQRPSDKKMCVSTMRVRGNDLREWIKVDGFV